MEEEDAARLRKQVKALFRRLQREVPTVDGIQYTELRVLAAVRRSSAPVSPGQLAAELSMTTSNVAAALRSLEKLGMISRSHDPSDGRKSLVSLTGQGKNVADETRKDHCSWLRSSLEDALTEEEQLLLLQAGDLMQRLADHGPTGMEETPAQSQEAKR